MALAMDAVSAAIHDNIVPSDPIERVTLRALALVSNGDGVEAAVSRLSRLLGPLALVLAVAGIGALLI